MAQPKPRREDLAPRNIDRIDTGPVFGEGDAARLNRLYGAVDMRVLMEAVLLERVAGEVAVVSSFGAESAVLLHVIAEVAPDTAVLFLETGKHFPETLAYRDALVARLGLTNLINLTPDAAQLAKRDETGLRWSYDPDGCCEIRKVQPLAKALKSGADGLGFDATITGRKGFQSATRAGLPRFELDRSDTAGRLKVNPLADWGSEKLEAYFAEHELPRHPLVADGFLSIGCMPCTSKVAPGEDPRSGRWRGWDKTECGIHVPGSTPPSDEGELPPGYEPAF